MRLPLLWLMLPLMLQPPRSRPATRGASRVAVSRRSPRRQSHGGTNSPRHTPRCAAFAAASSPTYAVEYSTVGHRPTLADQPGIDVLPAVPADRNDAAIPIPDRAPRTRPIDRRCARQAPVSPAHRTTSAGSPQDSAARSPAHRCRRDGSALSSPQSCRRRSPARAPPHRPESSRAVGSQADCPRRAWVLRNRCSDPWPVECGP